MKPVRFRSLFSALLLTAFLPGGYVRNVLSAAESGALTLEIIDPNPDLISAEGSIIPADTMEAIDRLAGIHPMRIGVVADGASQLLLRARTSNAVTFSISPRFGGLRDMNDNTAGVSAINVEPRMSSDGTWWVFAIYTAPDAVPGRRVHRMFMVTARDGMQSGSISLQLAAPPVLLVHGLWSSSSAWAGLSDLLRRDGFLICQGVDCTVNYGAVQPAPSFDPFATEPENQFAVNQLIAATTNVLNAVRQKGIAAARVDVVAHSLGGLIARSRVVLPDADRAYRRPDNFQCGDFHKLITVGTPHRGTPAADFLLSNRCARASAFGGTTLEGYLASSGRPFGQAIAEMRTVSPAITNLGATLGVAAHAIVGLAPGNSGTEGLLNALPRVLGYSITLDELLGGDRQHDTLVPRSSQTGGLPRTAVTLARNTVHTDIDARDRSETESRFIWRRIAQLLRTPAESKLFGNFTALETNAVPVVSEPCLQ